MSHVGGYSRLKSSPKQDAHSSREIRWSLSKSQSFVNVLAQRLGFTTFFTSRRRSRYSVFSRKLSLSLSITENFQSRTCRSESWGVDCASSPADHKTRVERLEVDTLERHELFLNVSDEGVTKRFRTESITKYTLTTINTR